MREGPPELSKAERDPRVESVETVDQALDLLMDLSTEAALTDASVEALLPLIESEPDRAGQLYMTLIESEAITPEDPEHKWIGRLERFLAKENDADMAAYLLEHATTLDGIERARLERVAAGEEG